MFSCMRTSQLQREPPTRFNVEGVPRKIEIELPDDVYGILERWAALEGISLPDLIQREVYRTKARTNDEISARIAARGPSKVKTADIVRDIREARENR
jgi:hypothetical protein